LRMGDAYERAGELADAERAYSDYLSAFPSGPARDEVSKRLETIRQTPSGTL